MENATRRSEEISHRLVSLKHLIDLIDGRRLLGQSAGPGTQHPGGQTLHASAALLMELSKGSASLLG
jgi:hypothetical protein